MDEWIIVHVHDDYNNSYTVAKIYEWSALEPELIMFTDSCRIIELSLEHQKNRTIPYKIK